MLYLPWTCEDDLKLGFATFEEAFVNQCDLLNTNSIGYEKHGLSVEAALEDYQENGPVLDVWDTLNSEVIQTEEDMRQPQRLDPDNAILNPDFYTGIQSCDITRDIGSSNISFTVQRNLLSDTDYRQLVRMLNKEQSDIFAVILNWCRNYYLSKTLEQKPLPFYTFITGGAGTGKSLLIKAIYNMAVTELRGEGDNPTDCTVLLLAPTGTAAFNIDGMTMHSALKLPIKQHSKQDEYIPLSQEKIHDLRCRFNALTIVIIDEISMVSSQDLYNIHRRLAEIKGSSQSDVYFGGVSVLAVGDLFQIPPVAARPVYALPKSPLARLAGSLWSRLFHIHHLNIIMRQRNDIEFANMLNRIRLSQHTDNDISMLNSRLINKTDPEYPHDALHIFPGNDAVDKHNAARLSTMNKPLITLHATDLKSDNSRLPETFSLPERTALTGGLCKTLTLCEGARVMIIKNVDVPDGLVNGTQGTVVSFWKPETSDKITAIIVKCDNDKSGTETCLKYPQINRKHPGCVPIFRDEVVLHIGKYNKGFQVIRQQFPLRLSWACTIHKTQGMTLTRAVVHVEGRFDAGQCYVALSRVTSLSGLFLSKFDKQKIKTSSETCAALEAMHSTPVVLVQNPVTQNPSNVMKIALLNTRSYARHFEDVNASSELLSADILCLTETWLKKHQTPHLQNMKAFRQDRLHKRSGGVVAHVSNQFEVHCNQSISTPDIYLLSLTISKNMKKVHPLIVYCAPTAKAAQSLKAIDGSITTIPQSDTVLILGDFNKVQLNQRQHNSFTALISSPTCKTGGVLDQVYTNTAEQMVTHIQPTYFSDHSVVWIGLPFYR